MFRYAGTILVVAIAVGIVAVPGLPVQPTYATSNSMAPAIEEGDVYFVVRTDDVETGDVVTFYSSRNGDYTTHRIVDRTADGFVTKGDNNPSTDQEAGHPPVDRSEIVGPVIEVGGEPLAISGTRPAISFLGSNQWALIGLAAFALLGPELWSSGTTKGRPERSVVLARDLVHPLFFGGAILGFILILWGASTHELTWVALGDVTGAAHTIPVGEPTEATVRVRTYTPPLTAVVVEADGVTILDQTVKGSTIELSVLVPAVESPGNYRSAVRVYPYPATLPEGLLRWLHGIHWFLAAAASMVPMFGAVTVLYGLTLDGKMRFRRPRSRWLRRFGGE